MLIWDEAIDLCQWWTKDYSADTLSKIKLLMNMGYKEILANFRRNQTLQTQTRTLESGVSAYMMPPTFLMGKKIKAIESDVGYPVEIVESEDHWDEITSNPQSASRPTHAFFRFRFGYGGTEVLLFPEPSNSTTQIQVSFESSDKDLSQLKYTTGTVAINNDDADVTGSGTTFIDAMVGRYLKVNDADGDGMWYRIASRSGNTAITLENFYAGSSISGKNFIIAEAFALPEEMQVLPAYYATWNIWSRAGNDKETKKYFALWNTGWEAAKDRYSIKSLGKTVRHRKDSSRLQFPVYPGYFPTEIS